jgi:hypothetical protein
VINGQIDISAEPNAYDLAPAALRKKARLHHNPHRS